MCVCCLHCRMHLPLKWDESFVIIVYLFDFYVFLSPLSFSFFFYLFAAAVAAVVCIWKIIESRCALRKHTKDLNCIEYCATHAYYSLSISNILGFQLFVHIRYLPVGFCVLSLPLFVIHPNAHWFLVALLLHIYFAVVLSCQMCECREREEQNGRRREFMQTGRSPLLCMHSKQLHQMPYRFVSTNILCILCGIFSFWTTEPEPKLNCMDYAPECSHCLPTDHTNCFPVIYILCNFYCSAWSGPARCAHSMMMNRQINSKC